MNLRAIIYFAFEQESCLFPAQRQRSDNPYGPFTYRGCILTPVVGWTTHHSIVEYKGKWYLFHHDSVPSGGKTWLLSLKVCELEYDENGDIVTIEGSNVDFLN